MASTSCLTELPRLTEEEVLRVLTERLLADTIYTSVNAMLIAVNPCMLIDKLYGVEQMQKYSGEDGPTLPPHVYRLAAAVHRGVVRGRSQSVVISGESGAGKTETFKRVIQYISFATSAMGGGSSLALPTGAAPQTMKAVEQLLVETVPVLESFGNASTVHNPNSSRFGKFVVLHFDASAQGGALHSVSVRTYLLEKTRVVRPGANERGFHIFYELLRGGDDALLQECGLAPLPTTRYLPPSSMEIPRPGGGDDALFGELKKALAAAEVAEADIKEVFKTVGAIALLGGVEFAKKGEKTLVAPGSEGALATVSSLLGVAGESLRAALCTKQMKAGTEWIESPNTLEVATGLVDGMAKGLYAKLFDYLVGQVNGLFASHAGGAAANDGGGGDRCYVGVLDIFGFEIFEVNSLEQLCINFANEKLQGIFNAVMLLAAKEEFAREGLPATALDFSGIDNAACRELVEGKPRGLFALLEEECVVPKGSDKGLADKLFDAAGRKHPCIRRPPKVKLGFALKHYAGEVVYDMAGFLPKNKDPFPEDLLVLLRNSSREFVSVLLAPTAAE